MLSVYSVCLGRGFNQGFFTRLVSYFHKELEMVILYPIIFRLKCLLAFFQMVIVDETLVEEAAEETVQNAKEDFCCEYCGNFFKTPRDLKIHHKTHIEMNISCPELDCGKQFGNKFNLKKHK